MLFTRFGEYINRGWREAAWVAFVFSLIPFMGWVSIVIMALITMRKGPKQGLFILLVTLIPSLAFLWYRIDVSLIFILLSSGIVLVWILALTLRETSDWGKVLFTALCGAIVFVVLLHLFVPDVHGYWFNFLNKLYSHADQDAQTFLQISPKMDMKSNLLTVAKIMTPLLIITQVIQALLNLLIARWWQSSLFNPGGLGRELYQLKLSYWYSIILLAVIVAIYWDVAGAWAILPVVVLMYFLAGVSVFHSLMQIKRKKNFLIGLFYGLVILLAPYSVAIVAGLGIADSFVDFRAQQARSTKNGEK